MATTPDPYTNPGGMLPGGTAPLPQRNPAPPGFSDALNGNSTAPPPGGYAGSQNGGVSSAGQSFLDSVMGQNNSRVTAATQASNPDAQDASKVAASLESYRQQRIDYYTRLRDTNAVPGSPAYQSYQNAIDTFTKASQADLLAMPGAPTQQTPNGPVAGVAPPDLLAIQNQSDRARLLGIGTAAYTPLIASLLDIAGGNVSSAASNAYQQGANKAEFAARAAADDAARRTYGDAASARGTGGQRAALFQAALGKAAEMRQDAYGKANQQRQQSALEAATIAAQEQNQARTAINSSLAGLTNLYGGQLYAGTEHQQDKNQDALNRAIELNSDIENKNAANQSTAIKGYVDTGAKFTGSV